MSFWWFQVTADTWGCYSGVSSEKEDVKSFSTRMISFQGKAARMKGESCIINKKIKALDLPVYGCLWADEPSRSDNPSQFLPKNMPDGHTAPAVHFGTLGYNERSAERSIPRSLDIRAQLPEHSFDDVWQWLRSRGDLLQYIFVEAFGDQLTARYRHNSISWEWSTNGKGQLLLARVGFGFAQSVPE